MSSAERANNNSMTAAPTKTQQEQWIVENQVFQIFDLFANLPRNAKSALVELQRDNHLEYLTRGLKRLDPSFCVLDANRPWLCYWILHSIALLGDYVEHEVENNVVDFLSRCQDPNGGYGGGPGQLPHLATTYAAVNALITVGGERSLSSINRWSVMFEVSHFFCNCAYWSHFEPSDMGFKIFCREKVYMFLKRMKQPSGAFRMHDAGEIDVRACYTAISVASVLNILDDELIQNVGDYILSCQTYEGGISGEPGAEAHGGYTFCGFATMILINEVNRLDLAGLLDWVAFRQGREGGFQGRTNKLVDSCYSFWQGGAFALLQRLHAILDEQLVNFGPQTGVASDISGGEESSDGTQVDDKTCHFKLGGTNASCPVNLNSIGYNFVKQPGEMEALYHRWSLQQYILLCAQDMEGGLKDKPGKRRDFYHTCYSLSGLSLSQHSWSQDEDAPPLPNAVMGPYANLLERTHPLFNVVLDQYYDAHEFFDTP
ncbi:protein farnesyltransferase subunit beta isoform X1 [Quercus lobata]|uniref:protein farnesyltransferase subunit beta isoform X1 n=1 Tax=Quercus lobata TaxID=97700 RepID=UPI0012484AFE|nr:protein farnesyltransferase subunit beta isoform X1 [Quercus lobata]